jgi:hypothetical protein
VNNQLSQSQLLEKPSLEKAVDSEVPAQSCSDICILVGLPF